MKTFVINLARARDRRAHMQAELSRSGFDYEWVDAVDGAALDTTDTSRVSPQWAGRVHCNPRILGCALSHLRAYDAVLQARVSSALILEDDTVLPAGLARLVEEAANLMTLPEVLLLELFSPKPPCEVSSVSSVKLSTGHVMAYPNDLLNVTAASAYIITAGACRKMLAALLPVRVPSDDWAYFHSHGLLTRVRCVAPLPVNISPHFASTIRHGNYSWRDHVYNVIERIPVAPAQMVLAFRRARFYGRTTNRVEIVDRPSKYALQHTA